MFGFGSIGGWEVVFLIVLALMLFGPRKIPEIARTVGKTVAQLRRASHEFRTGIEREVEAERIKDAGDVLRSLRDEVGAVRREATDAVRVDPGARPSSGSSGAPVPDPSAPSKDEAGRRGGTASGEGPVGDEPEDDGRG